MNLKKYYPLKLFAILLFNSFFLLNKVYCQDDFSKDTTLISKYYTKARALIYYYPDSASLYIDSILVLSKKHNYRKGFVDYYNLYGNIYYMKAENPKALEYFEKALGYTNSGTRKHIVVLSNIGLIYSNTLNEDSAKKYLLKTYELGIDKGHKGLAYKALFDLANLYASKDKYIKAYDYLSKAEEGMLKLNDSLKLLFIYNAYANLFADIGNFDYALKFYLKTINFDLKIDQINNLANIYSNLGYLYWSVKHDFDSARYYYRKSPEFALDYNRDYFTAFSYFNIGNTFIDEEKLDSAKYYYDKSATNKIFISYLKHRIAIDVNTGIYYMGKNQFDKAKPFLLQGLAKADSAGFLIFHRNAIQGLAMLEEYKGNYKLSSQYYQQVIQLNDSIKLNEAKVQLAKNEIDKLIAEKKYNYEIAQRDMNIAKENLKVNRIMLALSAAFSIFLIVFLFILFKNRNKRMRLVEQLEKKNNDLEELNKAKIKFFSIIGHDLKSPFNALIGFLSLLEKQWDEYDDKFKRETIEKLSSSAKDTFKLLENLLNWGRSQLGQIKVNREKVLVIELVNELVELFARDVDEKKLRLEINIQDGLEFNTDKLLLKQIIQNLLHNAIKFTPEGGEICIYSENNSICVKDSGIGVPKDRLAKVFELDFDFNRKGTNGEASTGMGLILCNDYARLIGGKLSVESIENKGSVFCLRFS